MIITFSTKVDDDVKQSYRLYNTDERQFDFYVMTYLNSPEGWSQDGYFFEIKEHGHIMIRLSSEKTIKQECGFGGLSCAEMGGNRIFLNAEKWFRGCKKSKLPLEDYREYMLSHEMGHILGKEHVKCPGKGKKAPIMMQQTLGIGNCIPNVNVKE